MKTNLLILFFGLCAPVFAVEAPTFGVFKGTAFSSVTLRQPLQLQSGEFSNCKNDERKLEIIRCDVQNGSLTVSGSPSAITVTFKRVSFLTDTPTAGSSYYLHGTTEIAIGERQVTVPAKVIVSFKDSKREKMIGVIELEDQYVKTFFEAYR